MLPIKSNFSLPYNFSPSTNATILNCITLNEIKFKIPRQLTNLIHFIEKIQPGLKIGNYGLSDEECTQIVKILILSHENKDQVVEKLFDLSFKFKEKLGENEFKSFFDAKYFLNSKNNIENFSTACDIFLCEKNIDNIKIMLDNFKETKLFENVSKIYALSLPDANPLRDLDHIISEFKTLNTDRDTLIFDSLKEQYLTVEKYYEDYKRTDDKHLKLIIDEIKKRTKEDLNLDDKLLLLAIASIVMQKEYGMKPHITQILAILSLTLPSLDKGCLAKVRTGEGKSIINTMLALCFAIEGKCVDIFTSATSLAVRDQKKFQKYYNFFGIKTSHICDNILNHSHFSGQIIYGINTDFEFAILREETKESNARCHYLNSKLTRPFDVALIDEVDNLFLDISLNSAIMAVPSTEKNHLLIEFIFKEVNRYEAPPPINSIVQDVRNAADINGDLKNILSYFSNIKLQTYIEAAINAKWNFHLNKDYAITYNEEDASSLNKKIIVPIAKTTGEFSINSRWENGRHEFLELKHEIPLEQETATYASISHAVLFDKYKGIYGLTGTIGNKIEIEEIEEIYKVNAIEVPTSRKILRSETALTCCIDENDFNIYLKQDVMNIQRKKRPILILCQNIEEVQKTCLFLKENHFNVNFISGHEVMAESNILELAGRPCAITVATNLASRGTDIILTEESKKNGGLHVILTYFPESKRVEEQCIGRSARQGQPGSAHIIVPFNSPFLSGIKNEARLYNTDLVYKAMDKQRDGQSKILSQKRKIHSKIEKINYKMAQKFFLAHKNLHQDILILKKQEDFAIQAEMQTKWAQFFSRLSEIKLKVEREKYDNYKFKIMRYKALSNKAFNNFKLQNQEFFKKYKTRIITSEEEVEKTQKEKLADILSALKPYIIFKNTLILSDGVSLGVLAVEGLSQNGGMWLSAVPYAEVVISASTGVYRIYNGQWKRGAGNFAMAIGSLYGGPLVSYTLNHGGTMLASITDLVEMGADYLTNPYKPKTVDAAYKVFNLEKSTVSLPIQVTRAYEKILADCYCLETKLLETINPYYLPNMLRINMENIKDIFLNAKILIFEDKKWELNQGEE